MGHDQRRTRPADVLVPNWDLGKPAAFDLTVASPLNQSILNACVTAGSSARVSEQRKHASNDVKCSELGWSCIPLAVETYGCWGAEARLHLSRLASRLAARLYCSKSHATSTLYGRLNLVLVRALLLYMLFVYMKLELIMIMHKCTGHHHHITPLPGHLR